MEAKIYFLNEDSICSLKRDERYPLKGWHNFERGHVISRDWNSYCEIVISNSRERWKVFPDSRAASLGFLPSYIVSCEKYDNLLLDSKSELELFQMLKTAYELKKIGVQEFEKYAKKAGISEKEILGRILNSENRPQAYKGAALGIALGFAVEATFGLLGIDDNLNPGLYSIIGGGVGGFVKQQIDLHPINLKAKREIEKSRKEIQIIQKNLESMIAL